MRLFKVVSVDGTQYLEDTGFTFKSSEQFISETKTKPGYAGHEYVLFPEGKKPPVVIKVAEVVQCTVTPGKSLW